MLIRANAMSRGGLKLLSRVSKHEEELQIVLRQIWSALNGREDSSETLGEDLDAKGRRR